MYLLGPALYKIGGYGYLIPQCEDNYLTMAGFEDFRPKTQAWNLAPAGSILFQFQKFKNLAHDP